MMVFVSFPKAQCYDGKDLGTQRTYKEKFLKYLNLLKDNNVSIEILLEDKLAMDMCAAAGITPAKITTCIAKPDLDWVSKYPEIDDLESYVFSRYDGTQKNLYDSEGKFPVSLALLKEGKAVYFRKRVEAYHKRYNYTLSKMLSERKNVLQFRVANSMDRGVAVSTTASMGDGRLLIEVGITQGFTSTYYGGAFVTEETIPMILSL